ncbi:MAG: hypothetical protein HFI68_01635 [Lachnospiraceae bacterium]|nr:hypothetical protein [Lachnospiraceae bacterium]
MAKVVLSHNLRERNFPFSVYRKRRRRARGNGEKLLLLTVKARKVILKVEPAGVFMSRKEARPAGAYGNELKK